MSNTLRPLFGSSEGKKYSPDLKGCKECPKKCHCCGGKGYHDDHGCSVCRNSGLSSYELFEHYERFFLRDLSQWSKCKKFLYSILK